MAMGPVQSSRSPRIKSGAFWGVVEVYSQVCQKVLQCSAVLHYFVVACQNPRCRDFCVTASLSRWLLPQPTERAFDCILSKVFNNGSTREIYRDVTGAWGTLVER